MKFFCALISIFVLAQAAKIELEYQTQWEAYKTEHKKVYETPMEELARYAIWKSNYELVQRHNSQADKGMHTYWMAVNKFADLSSHEFVHMFNGYNASMKLSTESKPTGLFTYNPNLQVPDKIVKKKI